MLLALGASYIQLGRMRDAVVVLERYVARVPDSASGHAALGIALLDVASMADARRALDRALAINPDQVNAREALARVHLVEGRPAAAAALLAPLLDKTSADVSDDTKQLYAESLIRSGDAAAAARLLGAEIAADPQRPIQTYALACLANIASATSDAAVPERKFRPTTGRTTPRARSASRACASIPTRRSKASTCRCHPRCWPHGRRRGWRRCSRSPTSAR